MTTLPEHAITEIHQFISLIQARITGAIEGAGEGEDSEAERLWKEVYGSAVINAASVEDVARQMGEMMSNKLTVATLVAVTVAMKLGDGRDLIEIFDEVEQELISRVAGD